MEIWKDILGFEGLYQISSLGRVKSLSRTFKTGGTYREVTTEDMILSHTVGKDGYCRITLKNKPIRKTYLVHRLVAEHFLPLDISRSFVNHMNCNKQDNTLQNLEWVNRTENMTHAWSNDLVGGNTGKFGASHGKSKKVEMYENGLLINTFDGIRQAARETGYHNTNIVKALKAGTSYNGKIWKYA